MTGKKDLQLLFFFMLILVIPFAGCGDESKQPEKTAGNEIEETASMEDPQQLMATLGEQLGKEAKFVLHADFDGDGEEETAAGTEDKNDVTAGTRLYFFERDDTLYSEVYRTDIFEGFPEESLITAIQPDSNAQQYLYYDTQDTYAGSGIIDVFAYIVDMKTQTVYSAHLYSGNDQSMLLFLNEAATDTWAEEYFQSVLSRTYEDITITDTDRPLLM